MSTTLHQADTRNVNEAVTQLENAAAARKCLLDGPQRAVQTTAMPFDICAAGTTGFGC